MIVFNGNGCSKFATVVDSIGTSGSISQKHINDLNAILMDETNYDRDYPEDLLTFLNSSVKFKSDSISDVIKELYNLLKRLGKDYHKDYSFLENMGFWDFIAANWLAKTRIKPKAKIANWSSRRANTDRERKRHPFKGPYILYAQHYDQINSKPSEDLGDIGKPKNSNSFTPLDCYDYYIKGKVSLRGELQEQIFYRNWIVPHFNILMAIKDYLASNKYGEERIRDVIADLSQLNATIDLASINDYKEISKMLTA
jgi:hypothetical protein